MYAGRKVEDSLVAELFRSLLFFFQAEDGIRDFHVTGVQTCALPILRWLPISGYTDPLEEGLQGLRSLVLPALTLGLALAAVVTRTLRSSMLDALSEDYVRTARAKGLSESRVIRG